MHPAWNVQDKGDVSITFIVCIILAFAVVGLSVYLIDRHNKRKK
jgi:uncharacterized membrane protein